MGKILVAGDSFGEFAGYHNHFTTSGYAEPQVGPGKASDSTHKYGWANKVNFKHWCEQLAEDIGYEAVTHAIGGSGISSNSFIAMQQILTGEYDICVYFVSHHERTIGCRALNAKDWTTNVLPNIAFEEGSIDQAYNPKEYDLYKFYKYHYHRNPNDKTLKGFNEMNKPVITHLNTQDVNNERNTEMLLNALQITPNDLTYLRSKPAYSFIHDSITGVLGLKALCDAKGITTVFASCFSGGVMEAINNMGIHIKHFPFYEVEQEGFGVRHDFPSHYNQQEHDLIYKKFKESYPEFFKLYKQKD